MTEAAHDEMINEKKTKNELDLTFDERAEIVPQVSRTL